MIMAGAGYAQKLKGANAEKRLPVTDDERARDPYEWQELQRERETMVFGPESARGSAFSDRW